MNSTPTFTGGWYATSSGNFYHSAKTDSTPTFTGGWYATSIIGLGDISQPDIAHLLLPAGGMLPQKSRVAILATLHSTPTFTGGWYATKVGRFLPTFLWR